MPWTSISSPDGFLPTHPLDPVAAEILPMIIETDFWRDVRKRPIPETRAMSAAGLAMLPPGEDVARTERLEIPVDGQVSLPAVLHAGASPRAVVIWLHGGGFVLGSVAEIDNFLRRLANKGLVVISAEYRLAPEHPFPTALDDTVAVIKWVDAQRAQLGLGDLPIHVGGDSAGGNLATVSALVLRGSSVKISGQLLAYPCTDNCDAASISRFDPPFLDRAELRFLLDQYAVTDGDRQDWRFAPIRAESLADLPPALVLTAEHDSLAQQAEEYGLRMRAEGGDVDIRRYLGQIHGFITMDAFGPGAGGEALAAIIEFIDSTAAKARA